MERLDRPALVHERRGQVIELAQMENVVTQLGDVFVESTGYRFSDMKPVVGKVPSLGGDTAWVMREILVGSGNASTLHSWAKLDPAGKEAVARASFELLVGFQLTSEQLQYNATR